MQTSIVTNLREDKAKRNSFFQLANKVFDLSLDAWYAGGFWTDRYLPYALVLGDRVVANVSVNRMETNWKGMRKTYLQIGTVMTDPDFRGRGFARSLIEKVLGDWNEKCDGIYLYANDTVLDFYPKFGFEKETEYSFSRPIDVAHDRMKGIAALGGNEACEAQSAKCPAFGPFRRLSMDASADRRILARCYRRGNPFSELPMLHNEGLLFFYCTGFLKEHVYYSAEYDAVAVMEQQGRTLFVHDFFGGQDFPLEALLHQLLMPGMNRIELGFTPLHTSDFSCAPIENDETLFVLKGKENPFHDAQVRMPSLSHA